MKNIAQYYAALNIDSAASLETVKQAYRQLAKTWHPDKYVGNPQLTSQAEVEIKKINQAYSAIKSYLEFENNIPDEIDNLRSQVGIKKNTPDFYYSQGVEHAEKQDDRDALASFGQAIKLDPERIEAYQYRGFILAKLGYENRAAAEFKQVARIKKKKKKRTSEDDSSTQTNTSYRNRASVEFEQVARIKKKKKKGASKGNSSTQTNTSSRNSVNSQAVKCSRTIAGMNQPITSIAMGSDNSLFACVYNDREIKLRDISTGQIVGTLRGHTDIINSLIVNSEGTTLISGGVDKTIRFWDLKAKKIVKTFGGYFDGHILAILALALSPDNKVLLSYGADNIINVWDLKHARIIRSISVSADLTCLEISPNCELFSGCLESQLNIRQIADGKVIRSINNNSDVLCMAFSPDSNILATGGVDRLVRLWDIRTGNIIYTCNGHCERLSNLAFTSNGKHLISTDEHGVIKVWQLQTGKEITSIEAHSRKIQAIASQPQTLISGDDEGNIKVWNCFL